MSQAKKYCTQSIQSNLVRLPPVVGVKLKYSALKTGLVQLEKEKTELKSHKN